MIFLIETFSLFPHLITIRFIIFLSPQIKYEFLLLAAGLKVDFDAVPGLRDALNDEGSGVCSNYSFDYVSKTWKVIQKLQSGNAIFTFPNSPVKCAGAPQKIMYLTEDFLSKV